MTTTVQTNNIGGIKDCLESISQLIPSITFFTKHHVFHLHIYQVNTPGRNL